MQGFERIRIEKRNSTIGTFRSLTLKRHVLWQFTIKQWDRLVWRVLVLVPSEVDRMAVAGYRAGLPEKEGLALGATGQGLELGSDCLFLGRCLEGYYPF
ncbi:MAG: hypothetical protein AB8B55_17765 [Mariniblastus sp.]